MATSTDVAHEHDEHDEHPAHPDDGVYIRVALVLGVLTAIEVVLSYKQPAGSQRIATAMLLVFASVKFAIVALYFMHLKFDNKVLRRLFVTGLVLAIFCYVAYLSTLHVFP